MCSAFTYICNILFTYEILLEHFLQKIYIPSLCKFLTTNNLNPPTYITAIFLANI